MTIGELIIDATRKLTDSGIITARLDCLVLLEDVLQRNRASLLAHEDQHVSPESYEQFDKLVTRRCTHEPLAYIRGTAPFYGRNFTVNSHVLVPRPETEACVEVIQSLPTTPRAVVADIGTGSGCIGITIALELPTASVDLYDIDRDALAVAQQNATALDASVGVYKSDLLQNLRRSYDIIVTNLPYVPDHFPINKAAGFEPARALFAGIDGLNAYRDFWQQATRLTTPPKHIVTESLPSQHHANALLARNHGYLLEQTIDFIQHFSKI